MTGPRRFALCLAAAAGAAGLAGCGQGSAPGTPSLHGLPLVTGARVTAMTRTCDGGAHPYCALELVLSASADRYPSSHALLAAERRRLQAAGWGPSSGDTDQETAAESPGHRQRITFATAGDDLESIDVGTITRSPRIGRALAEQMFDRRSALSMFLQAGSA